MSALGLDPVLLIAQIVSFSILLIVLKTFLFSKIQNALDERRLAVKNIFRDQEEIQKRLEKIETTQLEQQKVSRQKAIEIINQAKNEARTIASEIVSTAKSQALAQHQHSEELLQRDIEKARLALLADVKTISKSIVDNLLKDQQRIK